LYYKLGSFTKGAEQQSQAIDSLRKQVMELLLTTIRRFASNRQVTIARATPIVLLFITLKIDRSRARGLVRSDVTLRHDWRSLNRSTHPS